MAKQLARAETCWPQGSACTAVEKEEEEKDGRSDAYESSDEGPTDDDADDVADGTDGAPVVVAVVVGKTGEGAAAAGAGAGAAAAAAAVVGTKTVSSWARQDRNAELAATAAAATMPKHRARRFMAMTW
jgi:hypothetical protein